MKKRKRTTREDYAGEPQILEWLKEVEEALFAKWMSDTANIKVEREAIAKLEEEVAQRKAKIAELEGAS